MEPAPAATSSFFWAAGKARPARAHGSPPGRARQSSLRLALLALLLAAGLSPPRHAGAQRTSSGPGTAIATTSQALYAALANPAVATVWLPTSITLAAKDWQPPLLLSRNVTIQAYPLLQAENTVVSLDAANLTARLMLSPGVRLTLSELELTQHVLEVGHQLLILGASPGADVRLVRVVQRRLAGVPADRFLASAAALARPPAAPGNQVAFQLTRYCYNATRASSQQQKECYSDVVFMVDWAAFLPNATSRAFSGGNVSYGGYTLAVEESANVVENVVSSDCVDALSERECVVQLLTQLELGTISLHRKSADSNLVKVKAGHTCMHTVCMYERPALPTPWHAMVGTPFPLSDFGMRLFC